MYISTLQVARHSLINSQLVRTWHTLGKRINIAKNEEHKIHTVQCTTVHVHV